MGKKAGVSLRINVHETAVVLNVINQENGRLILLVDCGRAGIRERVQFGSAQSQRPQGQFATLFVIRTHTTILQGKWANSAAVGGIKLFSGPNATPAVAKLGISRRFTFDSSQNESFTPMFVDLLS